MASKEVKKYVFTCDWCGTEVVSDTDAELPANWLSIIIRKDSKGESSDEEICHHCSGGLDDYIDDRTRAATRPQVAERTERKAPSAE